MPAVLLIHSPLVGPCSMAALGHEFSSRNWFVTVPDLRAAMTDAAPAEAFIDLATAHVDVAAVDVLIGHSGAGAFLPAIAALTQPNVTVFIDAVVPSHPDQHSPSPGFIEFIDTLPQCDGRLPPWHQWWGADRMASIVPDERLRAQLAAETPRVPRSFYDRPVSLPSAWHTRNGCCYLQLSPAYHDDCAQAAAWGWPTAVLNGQHLDLATRAREVADSAIVLVGRASAAAN